MHSFVHREDNIWEELRWQPAIPIPKQIPEPEIPYIMQYKSHFQSDKPRTIEEKLLQGEHPYFCSPILQAVKLTSRSKHSQYINSEGQKRFQSSTYGAAATRRDRALSAAASMPPCFSFDTTCSRPA